MDLTKEYYLNKYDELSFLSDTKKCKTILMRNRDTGELVVEKIMPKSSLPIYRQLKEIHNKNIVNVVECFETEDSCISIEEYVNGKKIDNYCAEKNIKLEDCIGLMIELCNGLEEVHKKGIVHRDIQPKNIIVSNEGTLKLIDFDIARIPDSKKEKDTELLGTAGYAAPEQYGFSQTNNRSDIYSVGAVLNEILEQKQSRQNRKFPRNEKLNQIVEKCMEMDPQNRYVSVAELRVDLEECISSGAEQREKLEECISSVADKKYIEEELPPLTLKYIIRTIPGFKSGNFLYEIFAIFMYAVFLWAYGSIAFKYEHVELFNRVIGFILSELAFIIPYMYLTNIADIAKRFPKKKFVNKLQQYAYQIGVAIGLSILIVMVITLFLPI